MVCEGEEAFQSGDATRALSDYRSALVYAPNNPRFQFHLARALAATGRDDEARSYLLNLLLESPGSGEVNLELARIAARKGAMSDAVENYHRAIYGVWEHNPILMRWNVRHELCEFLLGRSAESEAEPEIIALAQDTPSADKNRKKVGWRAALARKAVAENLSCWSI
jgi:tetratricopeptide (TPR) repeat protein